MSDAWKPAVIFQVLLFLLGTAVFIKTLFYVTDFLGSTYSLSCS